MATGWHDGKWWPLFVPEWYHPKVSQYFFDPYSFLHIIHGFVFYGLWGWWPPQLVGSYTFQFFWMFVLGAILALLVELVFEIIENTQCCIDRWRSYIETIEHSDSVQNSVGDIISAVIGWYLAAGFHYADLPWLVLVWYSVTEVTFNVNELYLSSLLSRLYC